MSITTKLFGKNSTTHIHRERAGIQKFRKVSRTRCTMDNIVLPVVGISFVVFVLLTAVGVV